LSEPAEIILRKIKAYTPWPGSFTTFNNKILKILDAKVVFENQNKVGYVWQAENKYPVITTGKNSLELKTVQLEGKKTTSGKDFILGYPNFIGLELN